MKTNLHPRFSVLAATLAASGQLLVLYSQPTSAQTPVSDDFNPSVSGVYHDVYTMAVQTDGKILVGGWFIALGGQPRTSIARLNVDGTLDSGFNLNALGDSEMEGCALAVQTNGKILVGGEFTTLGGQPRGEHRAVECGRDAGHRIQSGGGRG